MRHWRFCLSLMYWKGVQERDLSIDYQESGCHWRHYPSIFGSYPVEIIRQFSMRNLDLITIFAPKREAYGHISPVLCSKWWGRCILQVCNLQLPPRRRPAWKLFSGPRGHDEHAFPTNNCFLFSSLYIRHWLNQRSSATVAGKLTLISQIIRPRSTCAER